VKRGGALNTQEGCALWAARQRGCYAAWGAARGREEKKIKEKNKKGERGWFSIGR